MKTKSIPGGYAKWHADWDARIKAEERRKALAAARDAVVQAARDWAKPCGIATTRETQQRALDAVIGAAEALQVAVAELERLEGGK